MIDSTVKVGDVVFAGDLVKVLHGTKYCTITYYDFDSLNISELHRQYRSFELLSTGYPNFKYWTIDGEKYSNLQEFDYGLSADVSAYMHIQSLVSATYNGNGGKNMLDKTEYVLAAKNETYLSNVGGEVLTMRTYNTDLSALDDLAFKYDNHRFIGWKENGVGDIIYPNTLLSLNNDIYLLAQWIRQYILNLDPGTYGNAGKILLPIDVKSPYDSGTNVLIAAQPDANYHLIKWIVNRTIENITPLYVATEEVVPHTYDPTEKYDIATYNLSIQMTNDTTVTPVYAKDYYNLEVYVNNSDYGYVTMQYANDYTASLNIVSYAKYEVDYGKYVVLLAKSKDNNHKFLTWSGDIDPKTSLNVNQYFSITKNNSISAIFGEVSRYIVRMYSVTDNNGTLVLVDAGGKLINNQPEDIELQGEYREGDDVSISVIVSDQYVLKQLILDGEDYPINQTYTVSIPKINKNHELCAIFDTYLINDTYTPITDHTNTVFNY